MKIADKEDFFFFFGAILEKGFIGRKNLHMFRPKCFLKNDFFFNFFLWDKK